MGGGNLPKSKLIDTIKSTLGYGMGYGRELDSWPNDNPFTTTSTIASLTTPEKVTPTQTAMLEEFQWLYSSTLKPIVKALSTLMPTSTSGSFITDKDEWGNNIETYRVDEPPHSPGLSLECRLEYPLSAVAFFSLPILFTVPINVLFMFSHHLTNVVAHISSYL